MSENRRVKDVAEYLKEVSEVKAKWPNSTLVFRGQENEKWPLESSAERRLKKSLPSQNRIPDQFFIEYHEYLLKKCKLKNYDQREQKQLDDLELLADLQHHGAATCLIDFTRNALVALWFACQKSDDVDGKVFVVNTADEKTFLETMPTDIKEAKSISDLLELKTRETDKKQAAGGPTPETLVASPNQPTFWYWTPAHLNERITAQHSLFLFGLPSSGGLNSEELIIESANKEQIRKELEDLHDIREESLFPDFVGFAYTQRYNAPYPIPDAEEYISRGVEAVQRGQYLDAIENFTKAIELKPDCAEAYYDRGLAYHNLVYHSLAYFSKGEYAQAIQDYTKAIELKPDYAEAYYARGSAYGSQDENYRAVQDFTKAIELKPDYAEAYAARGGNYNIQGEFDRAIQDSTKAIELKPDCDRAYAVRGDAYGGQGEFDRAIQDLTKTIELCPDDAITYAIRGRIYIIQGKYGRAIQDSTKAIELYPNYVEAYYARGLAWLHLQKWQEARSDLIAAKDVGPDIVALLQRYGNSVADLEQKIGIKLPKDIAAMLTENEN